MFNDLWTNKTTYAEYFSQALNKIHPNRNCPVAVSYIILKVYKERQHNSQKEKKALYFLHRVLISMLLHKHYLQTISTNYFSISTCTVLMMAFTNFYTCMYQRFHLPVCTVLKEGLLKLIYLIIINNCNTLKANLSIFFWKESKIGLIWVLFKVSICGKKRISAAIKKKGN